MTKLKKIILTTLISILALSAIVASGYLIKHIKNGKFHSNTTVANIDISGLSLNTAAQKIHESLPDYFNQKITLTFQDTDKQIPLSELGAKILIKETLTNIPRIKSQETTLFSLVFSKKAPKNYPLSLEIDTNRLSQTLEKNFNITQHTPKNANFALEGKKLTITEGQSGQAISPDFIADLKSLISQKETTPLTINTTEQQPQITLQDLQEKKDQYSQLLTRKITLVDPVYADDWVVSAVDYPQWITFENYTQQEDFFASNPSEIKITVNPETFNQYVDEEISQWLDREPDTLKIFYDENQQIQVEGKGHPGRKIMREQFVSRLQENLNTPNSEQNEITIPIQHLDATLDIQPEIAELGIQEILSVGHTSYYGSPANRVHNIKVGANKFSGKVIQPGESFSFNQNLGAVNAATGYRKELVIKPEGTIPEYGGGLCQVSTTLYRAVLLAGLDVVDRREHSYAVSYYSQILGHGLDATIYLGGQDFKFANNTDKPVLIHSYVEGDYELYFLFIGTSDGRTVELEGPVISDYTSPGPTQYIETTTLPAGETKQVEKPHTGFTVKWKRHITDAQGQVTTEDINTRYKAVPAKIMVGTSEPPTPEPL